MPHTTRPLVSVIIPIYNGQDYIQRCLDSIYAQNYPVSEIIIVNDGSTDRSVDILQKNLAVHPNMKLITQDNRGQGYARNRALERANGDYILFVDVDDYIDKNCLEILATEVMDHPVDIVHFGWKGSNGRRADNYMPAQVFGNRLELVGAECDELLRIPNYFSVHNLFRRKFLIDENIRYGEGYIYEDNEFIVSVATRANEIQLLNQALYTVYFSEVSSTRGKGRDRDHGETLINAINRSYAALESRLPGSPAYMANYFLEKFIINYQKRIPNSYKRQYRCDFIDTMHRQTINLPNDDSSSKFLRLCLKLHIFARRRYAIFWLCVLYKTRVIPVLKPQR